MSVRAKIRSNKPNKKGLVPIVIQIIVNGKSTEISLSQYIPEKYWNPSKELVSKGHEGHEAINLLIKTRKGQLENSIASHEAMEKPYSAKSIVKELKHKLQGTKEGLNSEICNISKYIDVQIKENPEGLAYGTLATYRPLLTAIQEFDHNATFDSVDLKWLERFRQYLLQERGNGQNTVHTRLKVLRKMFNRAITHGHTDNYPFQKYKLTKKETKRAYLTRSDLSTITDKVRPKSKTDTLILDSFIFGCYTGLRFGDICTLNGTELSVNKGQLYFSKELSKGDTGSRVNFRLPERAVAILEKYEVRSKIGKSHLVFPIIEVLAMKDPTILRKRISGRGAYFNKRLKILIPFSLLGKHITFHVSRHTFATLLLNTPNVGLESVSAILGHKDQTTTAIYANLLESTKDDAIDAFDNDSQVLLERQ